jgi:hypothetical protein
LALGVLKYASGLKKYRLSSLGQYLPKIDSANDFVFLLTPFKEKVAAESCVTLSTYDTVEGLRLARDGGSRSCAAPDLINESRSASTREP